MEFQTTTKPQKSDRPNRSTSSAVKSTPQTPTHELLQMQQIVGNRAVSRLIQTKLKVGKPGDVYEQEADQIADRVMQMPNPQGKTGLTNTLSIQPLSIQRMSSEEETVNRMAMEEEKPIQKQAEDEESSVQMKEEEETKVAQPQMKEEKDESLQMKAEDEPETVQTKTMSSSAKATPKIENRLSSRQHGGTPLGSNVQNFMEPRFGRSFAHVRVHTDSEAVQMNQELHAQAFTHQHNIYFNQGQYNPENRAGKQLLAHELTHVVQQTGASGTLQTKEMPVASSTIAPPPTTEKPKPTPKQTATPTTEAPPPKPKKETQSKGTSPEKPKATEPIAAPESVAPTAPPPEKAGGDELLMPEPPTTLSAGDRNRIAQVQNNSTKVANQQAQLPDSATNVNEARGAVAEPATETQARANENLVETLGAKEPPSPEIEKLCETIKKAIRSQRPPDEASLVKSNPQQVAEQEGTRLNTAVKGDAQKVQSNYDQLQTPPQGTPQQEPQPAETPPAKIDTPAPGAQAAVPKPVPAENLSLDADVAAGGSRMEEAGMNSKAAKVITTGPVAKARDAHEELAETAASDPALVMAEQQAALDKARGDMLALQQAAMISLASSRAKTVGGVTNQQQGMVETEEQTRDRIGKQAQDIFDNAQKTVNDLLTPLPDTAMEKWKTGIKIASEKFEQQLKKVEGWIKERHSGGWGAAVEIWDDVTGLPDWITKAYNTAEQEFGDEVCTLIREISSDVNTVIKTCETIIDTARQEIGKLFQDLPDSLKEWAAGEQAKFADKLDGLNQKAQETRNNFNQNLENQASATVQEIREKIHALREKAKGILGRFADAVQEFIDDPVKAIINGLLEIVGIPPASFWALVAKIQQVIGDIADDPEKFANNLLAAIKLGFQKFFDRIGEHLLKGFLDWLLSGLGSVGVEIPKDLSIKSVITFFLQLMGITWAKIRKLLVKHIGEKNIALIEKAFQVVAHLIELGPEGIFEMLKKKLDPNNIIKQVIDAAVNFLIEALIKQVSARIVLLFNPVGAIAQAVEAIYRVLKWIFENAARLFSLVETVVNGIGNVIAGNIGGMAEAVEMALAQVIVPVIDFLAEYANLGDLPLKIADVIKGFQEWIEGLLDQVIAWLVEQGKKLLAAVGLGGDDKKKDGTYDGQIGKVVNFTAAKESHQLWIVQQGNDAVVMMSSAEKPVSEQLNEYAQDLQDKEKQGTVTEKQVEEVTKLIIQAQQILAQLNTNADKLAGDTANPEVKPEELSAKDDTVEGNEDQLKLSIEKIITEIRKALGLRPKELEGKETPKLNTLEEQEPKVSYRYVDDWKSYNSKGGTQPLIIYVEGRAARKLGRNAEDPSLTFYSQLNYEGYSKNDKKIEFLKSQTVKGKQVLVLEKTTGRPNGYRIPDIFREGRRVGDVKRREELYLDPQMKDNVRIARGDRVRLAEDPTKPFPPAGRFDLIVRAPSDDLPRGTHVFAPLQEAVEATGGHIFELL